MSGTVFVNDHTTWMPSVAVVQGVLDDLFKILQPAQPELAASLMEPARGYGWGLWDLRSFAPEQFQRVLHALETVVEGDIRSRRVERGPQHHFGYSIRISLFKALLVCDLRSGVDLSPTGVLLVRRGVEWVVPSWIYNLVLEHLAAMMPLDQPDATAILLEARTHQYNGGYDLSSWAPPQMRLVYTAMRFVEPHYDKTRGSAVAPQFFDELVPALSRLLQFIEQDPRIPGDPL
jgi:hypothetical protein